MSIINHIKSYHSTNRLSWDEYFMSICELTSLRSPSIKKQVGCIIVKDKHIISTGYNGFPAGAEHIPLIINGKEINTIHAEQNAIAQGAKLGISINNSTLYVTHFPCINCSKMIIASGITRIIYLNDNHNEDSINLLKSGGIEIHKF